MANRILLQTLLRFSDDIKSGAAKVQDVITDYFNTTGKSVTDEERGIILKEFQDNAPSNVEPIDFGQNIKGIYDEAQGPGAGDAMVEALKSPGAKKSKEIMEEALGVTLRGDETFGELMEMKNALKTKEADNTPSFIKDFDKNLDRLAFARFNKAYKDLEIDEKDTILASMRKVGDEVFGTSTVPDPIKDFDKNLDRLALARFNKTYKELDVDEKDSILATMKKIGDEVFGTKKEGLASLYPKGETDSIFDIKNDKRMEVAEFMKAMRAAGIKNEDVMKTAKITDVAEGKRAATTLARAADMGADTKIKQELLGTLDEDIATNSPRFFQEEYMGFDSMGNLLENISTTVNNGIYDDLLQQGVPEEKVDEVFRYIANIRDNVKYDPKALVRKIAEDLELEDIKYDTTFWDNYIDEILIRIQKPAPRFADGGLV